MDILATDINAFAAFALRLGHIFYFTVLPILLVASVGFIVHRKLRLDTPTLTRLNFYFTVPALVYFSVVTSKVRLDDVGTVLLFCLLVQASLVIITLITAAIRGIARDQRRAMLMSVMFYNSGNFGLPLQELAFRQMGFAPFAASIQVFVMLFQNILSFTLGIFIVAGGKLAGNSLRKQLRHMLAFPPLYALLAAIATVKIRSLLGENAAEVSAVLEPFWQALVYIKGGFFAIALGTLGVQLAEVTRGASKYPIKLTVALRLLIGPVLGLAVIYLLGLRGLTAQILLISTSSPTAVNAMLLCLQFDNHPEFLARNVLYSTLAAPLTVTLVIFIAQGGFFERLEILDSDTTNATEISCNKPEQRNMNNDTATMLGRNSQRQVLYQWPTDLRRPHMAGNGYRRPAHELAYGSGYIR